MIYQGNYRPLELSNRNHFENFNESIVVMSFVHTFIFTEFVPDQERQYEAGWTLIVLISIYLIAHILNIFMIFVRWFKLIIMRCCNRTFKKSNFSNKRSSIHPNPYEIKPRIIIPPIKKHWQPKMTVITEQEDDESQVDQMVTFRRKNFNNPYKPSSDQENSLNIELKFRLKKF